MHLPLKKRRLIGCRNAEEADTGGSGLRIVPTEINASGSSSSLIEINDASSSSIMPTGYHYEVFLSFRGPDTRDGFTDHLYKGLCDAGICAFRDDEEVREGSEIGPNLLLAIKNSKILIPVISMNYGSSKWCLDELVQIMECKNDNTETIVLPIFYKVEPSDVRHQKASFGDAFRTHERRFGPMTLLKWKQALSEVCSLKGWEAKGSETCLVKSVVGKVSSELKKKFELVLPENLVGIERHVNNFIEFLDNNSGATHFVGIHGMGGIGKTTLAKAIYNKLSNQYEHRCFLDDVRESSKTKGIDHLQNKLVFDILKQEDRLSNKDEGINMIRSRLKGKKVLILLDDVDDVDQLKALAGSCDWFSSGSKIIITTRNKRILDNAAVDYKYELEEMDKETSLTLFSRHAFGEDAPPSEFESLARDVVFSTGGLPLSLEVLGSFLRQRELNVWRDTLKKIRKVPPLKVQERLKISYDALDDGQKKIFLDIACFLNKTDVRIAYYMWEGSGFFPNDGIEELKFRSLVKVGDDHELIMHDQLRDLGRDIVRKENEEACYRSRLWDSKEIWEILQEDEGSGKIEAIYLKQGSSEGSGKTTDQGDNILMGKQFEKLWNLRFLDACGAHFIGDFKNSMKKLKWLQWLNCPPTFKAKNFHLKELLVLDLSVSKISDKWKGWSSIMMAKKLKYLNLAFCGSLERTSFLSAFENLEVLILAYCERIGQIDSSIGNMKSLVRLDLRGCERLKGLPAEVGKLEALEELLLESSGIRQLPDSIGALQKLKILDISYTKIEEYQTASGIWESRNSEY